MQKCKHLRALNGRMTMAGVGATIVAAAPAAGGAASAAGAGEAAAAASSHFMCEGCSKMATTFLSSAVRLCIRKCMPVSMYVSVCVLVFKMKVICQLITQLVVVPVQMPVLVPEPVPRRKLFHLAFQVCWHLNEVIMKAVFLRGAGGEVRAQAGSRQSQATRLQSSAN